MLGTRVQGYPVHSYVPAGTSVTGPTKLAHCKNCCKYSPECWTVPWWGLARSKHSHLLEKRACFTPNRSRRGSSSRGGRRVPEEGGSESGFLTCSHTAQAEAQQQRQESIHVPLSGGAGRSGPWAGSRRGLSPCLDKRLHTLRKT